MDAENWLHQLEEDFSSMFLKKASCLVWKVLEKVCYLYAQDDHRTQLDYLCIIPGNSVLRLPNAFFLVLISLSKHHEQFISELLGVRSTVPKYLGIMLGSVEGRITEWKLLWN